MANKYHPPVDKSWANYYSKWYLADKFGTRRNGYYHSGIDINIKTGGDTDLGYRVYAIADGVVLGVDTKSTLGFGKQVYVKITYKGKTLYVGYNHLMRVDVKTGDKVKAGQQIGLLGKSGTKWAHLHLSIKNTANGMDNVPNTLQELKQWENPQTMLAEMAAAPDTISSQEPVSNDSGCREARDFYWTEGAKLAEILGVELKESFHFSRLPVAAKEEMDKQQRYRSERNEARDERDTALEASRKTNGELLQEIDNRKEQISRLNDKLLIAENDRKDLEVKLKDELKNVKVVEVSRETDLIQIERLQERLDSLQIAFDDEAKLKGKALNRIAQLESEAANDKTRINNLLNKRTQEMPATKVVSSLFGALWSKLRGMPVSFESE